MQPHCRRRPAGPLRPAGGLAGGPGAGADRSQARVAGGRPSGAKACENVFFGRKVHFFGTALKLAKPRRCTRWRMTSMNRVIQGHGSARIARSWASRTAVSSAIRRVCAGALMEQLPPPPPLRARTQPRRQRCSGRGRRRRREGLQMRKSSRRHPGTSCPVQDARSLHKSLRPNVGRLRPSDGGAGQHRQRLVQSI